ncbi:PREDICTED: uncharacterized protein LOC109169236 [Ipomoea nil]|uniref:uncharacterized protein LOC109169236 n=1 Tax=Ipomoea nil TaxID=35883 RepID=UPI000901F14E|nr:PREDICTED: uncharacterized protein LOC109169236 [Ipomoea nil]
MKTPTTVFPLVAIQKLLKSIWGKWNIQAIVVASLAFQGILEFLAPVRKRSKRSSTHLIIWSAYLLADYFATFSIGLINSSAEDLDHNSSRIAAFWAPFLLLHLGGPHTITSFDLEDNNLWHRHLLTLLVQVLSVLLVFYRFQIFIHRELLIPTGIIFFAGIIKYAERTRSLYLASLSHMKKSMLESSSDNKSSSLKPTSVQGSEGAVDRELEIIQMGYTYFQFFKGFIIDHGFSNIEGKLEAVKNLFLKLDHKEAYKVLEIELNFMYDALFTKMAAVQWMSSFGYGYRFVVHLLLLAVAIIFVFFHKLRADDLDISITYLLLGGAIFLDFVALAKLVFSLWTVAIMLEEVEKCKASPRKEEGNWISGLTRNHKIIKTIKAITTWISSRQRWSNEIRQYSLINHSIKQGWPCIDSIAEKSGLTERLDACRYTVTDTVGCGLLEQVFHYIKKKAETGETKDGGEPPATREVVRYKDYDDCVLIWHVATEICYFTIDSEKDDDPNRKICRNISEYLVYFLVMEGKLTSTVPGNIGMRFRDICWEEVNHTRAELKTRLASAAIIGKNNYFLDCIKHMASAKMEDFKDFCTITNWKNNNADTNTDTEACDRKRSTWEQITRKWEDKKRKGACEWLINGFTEKENKGDENDNHPKSILAEAVKLAKHLKSCCCSPGDVENPAATSEEHYSHHNPNRADNNCCSEKELWEIVRHVWVGLLLYGASHCRHDVQYLNKGGELLTFVRLLMLHFGLTDAFKIEGGFKLEPELKQVIHQHKNLSHFLPTIISNFLP